MWQMHYIIQITLYYLQKCQKWFFFGLSMLWESDYTLGSHLESNKINDLLIYQVFDW